MGLLSLGRKKEDAAPDDSVFTAQSADAAAASAPPKARRKTRAADPIDPVLPEKQRARRRLVGAVALVLAAVIGLPMILDPEPKPLASDISIDIPAKDKARPAAPSSDKAVPPAAALDQREEIMSPDAAPATANAKAANGAATAAAATAGAAALAAAAPKADANKADANKADAKPDPRSDTKAATAEGKPESKAQAKGDAPAEAGKADSKDAARRSEDTRAKAILDGRETAGEQKAHADKSDTYMLQVAALASPDKVRELQNKLKAAGIKSQTQKVATQSGERIRVRVGPVHGRAEAEKMKARLAKLGYNGTLVPA